MSSTRRNFIKQAGAGAVARVISVPLLPKDGVNELLNPAEAVRGTQPVPSEQNLHIDFRSNHPGAECYFIGNGLITAALQTASNPEAGTHCGLFVMSPEHFGRRASTLLFHPERGVEHTRFVVTVDGEQYLPEYNSSKVSWDYPGETPTIVIEWEAGNCHVREELYCPVNVSAIIRNVKITNKGDTSISVQALARLYPNLMLFDEYHVDREKFTLTAIGFLRMQLFSSESSGVGDRNLNFDFHVVAAGASVVLNIVFTLNTTREEFERTSINTMKEETSSFWKSRTQVNLYHTGLNHLFNCSKTALRASVAASGKTDGGIW